MRCSGLWQLVSGNAVAQTKEALKAAEARAKEAEVKAKLLEDILLQRPDVLSQVPSKSDCCVSVPVPLPELGTPTSNMQGTSESLIGAVPNGDLEQDYDLVIIGGGPAGVAAALQAATLGRRVLLVDKPKAPPLPSGLDLFFGAPTGLFSKALRECGKKICVETMQSQGLYDNVIWGQIQGMCCNMASMNAENQLQYLQKFKIGYLQAHANIVAPRKILVTRADGSHCIVTTEKILVATGSKPLRPPEIPFDDERVFDSDTVNTLKFLPRSVVIMGAGIIAIEYAKIFRKLGAQVSMLIRSNAKSSIERIGIDRDICDELLLSLREDKVAIYEQTSVVSYIVTGNGRGQVNLVLKSSDPDVPAEIVCDIFLGALGRKPNTTGFGLEKLKVKLADKGKHILVNENYETNIESIFAAGDVLGPPSLASTSVHQAKGAILAMFEEGAKDRPTSFPVGMWTTPECAYYGLTKEAAEKQGIQVTEGMARYTQCLRGRVFAPDGLVKLVFRTNDGRILGVHLIGADACELVHYGMDLVNQKVTIFKLISTLFTAVTYHELFKEAALDGNSKLDFGAEWQAILKEIGACVKDPSSQAPLDEHKLKQQFDMMDASGDGSLDADELHAVFRKLGKDVKKGTISNLIRLADEDGNGTIEWSEFAKIFEIVQSLGGDSTFGRQDTPVF